MRSHLTHLLLLLPTVAGNAIAKTSLGTIVGNTLVPRLGEGLVNQWMGIQYATAARFTPPVDRTDRFPGGRLEAFQAGAQCLGYADPQNHNGAEECLFLNVWSPACSPRSRPPVAPCVLIPLPRCSLVSL